MKKLTPEQESIIGDLRHHEKKLMYLQMKDIDNTDTMVCGLCKHYDSDMCYCSARGEHEMYEGDSCDGYEACD